MLRVQYFLKLRYWLWSYSSVQHILPKMTETFEYVLLPKSFSSGTVLRIENFVKFSFESCCTAASLFSLQSNPSVRHLTSIVLPWKEANLVLDNMEILNGECKVSIFSKSRVIIVFFSCSCCFYLYLTLFLKRWVWCNIDWCIFVFNLFLIRYSPFTFEKDDRGAVEGGNLD